MPSIDGEESAEEDVERSPNEDENVSEEDDDDDSMSSVSEDSSSDSIDETENERRRAECLDDMADLERQFVELKEQLYCERLSQVEKKLDEVATELASEYNGPLAELKEMCQIRLEVADILKQCRLVNVENKYEAEEQSTVQHFESEKLALMEGMKADLEEKIRKLEEDKHNIDISADVWLESQSISKKHRRAADGVLSFDKRRKPVTVSGPYIVYMLKEMDILEDWAAIRKAKGALARRKAQRSYQSEKISFSARYEDGKLYYEGEWFHKGCQINIEGKDGTNCSAMITGINTGEILVRRNDGYKTNLYIGQLQKGKFKIKKP
ncbi:breast cancer metastasis-suppressor 1-like protein-A [Exaiptasia diaphana]|uniref:Breast cancer metastasis-suppressor 1-like protein n=1 Tax=Exaiptasia diaphana TaxID=2652724 RepID=A0A913XRY7_EXADI|nr:breast cancer metastasis-suppressor 1-like protein-A [Exaiptasia diaphana]KXJ24723.1 Breast cancer metastasis-suppressor 1-like protein-A [Exaiptasia diaphana]